MMTNLKTAIGTICHDLTARAASGTGRSGPAWFEPKAGPNYVKILLHHAPAGVRDPSPATFCFVVREDEPFGWYNYRAGDILPPKTSRAPWKMDTGAVGNVLVPEGRESYWVLRYGSDLGLW